LTSCSKHPQGTTEEEIEQEEAEEAEESALGPLLPLLPPVQNVLRERSKKRFNRSKQRKPRGFFSLPAFSTFPGSAEQR
jgi:hypothetical protein